MGKGTRIAATNMARTPYRAIGGENLAASVRRDPRLTRGEEFGSGLGADLDDGAELP
jgi:hypothetical protein